ncbi:MAG: cytochrome c [Phyllobacteriaceae bacterium]|nr:cytochrome c [Phyllobacteriaceae bacterium]
MKILHSLAVIGVVATTGVGVAYAAGALQERQTILKGFGDETRPVVHMLKGQEPFDLAKVKAALATYAAGAEKLPGLFPDNSKTGKTEASPKIWDEKAKFEGLFAKLKSESEAASAAITDQASLKANFPKVLGTCKACHDDFRIEK